MIKENAGIKQEARGNLKESYSLYDRAEICPLWAYIDATVRNNTQSLILSGTAPDGVLQRVKTELSIELSELSGNQHAGALKNCMRKMYTLKALIQGAQISLSLCLCNEYDEAITWFRKRNVQAKDIPTLVSRGISFIKAQNSRLKSEMKRYENLTSSGKGGEITEMYFTETLIALSKHVGFRLDKNIMLAEYAAYLKDLKQTIERSKQHGRK